MVKYVEFDSFDEYGIHITSINDKESHLIKLASNNYSSELMEVINNFRRDPKYYYIVINALGSLEAWGPNRNGDAFPRKGLSHHSLRSDMRSLNDYGYKTFEYYANLFKNHVNKDPNKGFGKVVFSHWNPRIERVELIVGVDRFKGQDIIDAIEEGKLVSVSMGCRVRYDECNICGKQARKVEDYCHHLKKYMGKMVTDDLAEKWSKETGKTILPGTIVYAVNAFPRFFDISKVYVGAEPTSYVLGKVASAHITKSTDIAEAYGITDEMIDKLAIIGKHGTINKEIGSGDIDDPDGKVTSGNDAKINALKKVLDSKVKKTIECEHRIPNKILDPLAKTMDLRDIFSTMFGLGIHPKPAEFQRIMVIKMGRPDVADYLDKNNLIFDRNEDVEPIDIDINPQRFNNIIASALGQYIEKRSMFPDILEKRIEQEMVKTAQIPMIEEESSIVTPRNILLGLAALYAGIKLKAMNYGPKQMMDAFVSKPWLGALVGSGLAYKLLMHDKNKEISKLLVPAREFENSLPNTYFSGKPFEKISSLAGSAAVGALAGTIMLPFSYLINAYNQRSLYKSGQQLFPGAGASPKAIATGAGATVGLANLVGDTFASKAIPKIKGLLKGIVR